jgi:hypothetical protein
MNFCVSFAGLLVPALANNHAIRRHNDRTDHRIGRRPALSPCGVKQRTTHVLLVDRSAGYHFS